MGVYTIGMGVVSLIAANWDAISSDTKILTYFFVLISVAVFQVRTFSTKPLVSESLRGAFYLLTIAGIGLIAQVFHLPSNGWSGFAFWTALSFPTMVLARHPLLTGAWWGGYFLTLFLWANYFSAWEKDAIGALVAFMTLFPLLFYPWIGTLKQLAVFVKPLAPTRSIVLWLVLPILLDLNASSGHILTDNLPKSGGIVLVLAIGYGLLRYWDSIQDRTIDGKNFTSQTMGVGVPLLLLGIECFFPGKIMAHDFGGALRFFVITIAGSYYAHRNGMHRLFNSLTLLIALRLIGVYIQVFGSLMVMGFGMIISGCVVLAIAYGWVKFRRLYNQAHKGGKDDL